MPKEGALGWGRPGSDCHWERETGVPGGAKSQTRKWTGEKEKLRISETQGGSEGKMEMQWVRLMQPGRGGQERFGG